MSGETGLHAWIAARAVAWRKIDPLIAVLRRNGRATAGEALEAIESYRNLARDLGLSRRLLPQRQVTRALEEQYSLLHALIHRPSGSWRNRLAILFIRLVPQVVQELRHRIALVTALFVGAALAGAWLITTYPELIGLVASEDMIRTVESGRLWTDNLLNVAPPALLSVQILSNNIVVSLMAFCSGILFGLGTFYIIMLNGLMLGSVFAFTYQHGVSAGLFRFVLAHGVVELSVICLAGAAGLAVGEASSGR